jgi:hypothetical protein
VRDATGSYSAALGASAIGLLLTCGGFLLMPRYPTNIPAPVNIT